MDDSFKIFGIKRFFVFMCGCTGVVAWFASLWLPSYKFGKAMTGLECFVYSALNAFFDAKSPEGKALRLTSQIASAGNLLFLLLLVLVLRRKSAVKKTKLACGVGLLLLTVCFQVAGIER